MTLLVTPQTAVALETGNGQREGSTTSMLELYSGPRGQCCNESSRKLMSVSRCRCHDGELLPRRMLSPQSSTTRGANLAGTHWGGNNRGEGRRRCRPLALTTARAVIVSLCWRLSASTALAVSATLWDVVSTDPDYSMLTSCLEKADPTLVDALRRSGEQPLTLFAPSNCGFQESDWSRRLDTSSVAGNDSIFHLRCQEEESATALLSYHISTTTTPTPYIGEEFHTMLGDDASTRFYGITKSSDVPASSFPIQFVDASNVTSTPAKVGETSYLFKLDQVLRPPVGTIWKTLQADPSFSKLVAALNETDLARTLDTLEGTTRYTLFAPDDDAIEASPDFPEDSEALEVLISFHTLATGAYPQSVSGAHFSQQLFKVDPAGGSLSRDYYREFYADSFEGGQVTSLAGPLLNVTRSPTIHPAASSCPWTGSPRGSSARELGEDGEDRPATQASAASWLADTSLLIEGVPVSEADITATNGVVHRLSAQAMAAPATVAGVLLDPPFPLSAAEGEGFFAAMGELVQLAWPLVNETLMAEGPLTVLAPTDAAFDLAIAAGQLPLRPWNQSSPSSSSSSSTILTPEAAARLLLSHTLRTPDGPLLFSPTASDPFSSGFVSGDRFATAVSVAAGGSGAVEVQVKVVDVGTRSATTGSADVSDREVYIDNARVTQCVDGSGVGHDCGSSAQPSNTYALNGAKLCAVHAVDRVLFPADPETDLSELLDASPSLSRFSDLLREHHLLPGGEGAATSRLTVFAPTNEALAQLEEKRPWLFENSMGVASDASGDGGGGGTRGVGEWSPLRELLAYHLVPDDGMFSRYFDESYRLTQTLALDGQAPIDIRFTGGNATDVVSSAALRSGNGDPLRTRSSLWVNFQACSSIDASASNGVLHVLAFGNDVGDGAGVVVPDVLELTFAFGFHDTYSAIVGTGAHDTSGGATEIVSSGVVEDASGFPSASTGGASVKDVLRGPSPHTLLVVADSLLGGSPSCLTGEVSRRTGLSADTLRYQTLIGDQDLRFPGVASLKMETLFGGDAHAFNNSENPGNPFVPMNGSGVYVDQSQVISSAMDMMALNGRIHEISEALRAPATDLFALLSSRSELSGWADWVELTGLAELLADPAAGPFTVFAPVDDSLELIPGRMAIGADSDTLANLLLFHVAVGASESVEKLASANVGAGGYDHSVEIQDHHAASRGGVEEAGEQGRLFTSTLANATSEERSVLAGDRFASGRSLRTLLGDDAPPLVVQIAPDDAEGSGTVRVFVGPGQRQERHSRIEELGNLFLGAFAAEVVLPNLNALNGVVHGISGVMTYPGYERPDPVVDGE